MLKLTIFSLLMLATSACEEDAKSVYLTQCKRINQATIMTSKGKSPKQKAAILESLDDCQALVDKHHASCRNAMDSSVSIGGEPKVAYYVSCIRKRSKATF